MANNLKTLGQIKADPRCADVWYEGEDGWWILLSPGYFYPESGAHAVHEFNLPSLAREFATVKPCTCADCAHHWWKTKTLP